jgi:hypothetical protein
MNSTAQPTAAQPQQATPAATVRAYLEAFYSGDFSAARRLLADNLSFAGPFVEADNADAFLASAQPLRAMVRGHRILAQWEDGDQTSTWYEMNLNTPHANGSVLVSEWNTVRDGRVATANLVFDTAAFRKFLPHAGRATG